MLRPLIPAVALASAGLLAAAAAPAAQAATRYDGMRLAVRSVFFAPDTGSGPACVVEAQSTGRAALALAEAHVAFTAPHGRIVERATVSFIRPVQVLPGTVLDGQVTGRSGAGATGCRVLDTAESSTYQLADTAYRTTVTSDVLDDGGSIRRISGTLRNTGHQRGRYTAVTIVVRDGRGTARYVASFATGDVAPGHTTTWSTVIPAKGPAGAPGVYRLSARADADTDVPATHDVRLTARGRTLTAYLGNSKPGTNAGQTLVLERVVDGATRAVASRRTDASGSVTFTAPSPGRYLAFWPGPPHGTPTASVAVTVR